MAVKIKKKKTTTKSTSSKKKSAVKKKTADNKKSSVVKKTTAKTKVKTSEKVGKKKQRKLKGSARTCISCDAPISKARVDALPDVELCVNCQSEAEISGGSEFGSDSNDWSKADSWAESHSEQD